MNIPYRRIGFLSIRRFFPKLYAKKDSGIHKIQDYFVEFTKQTNSDPDYFMTWLNKDASGADAEEYWNQYQQFLAQKEKEEKAKKEDEENAQNEENALTEEEIRDWLK